MNDQEDQASRDGRELETLKGLIAEHESLCVYKGILDDELLLGFIRGKKFNVQAALNCLVAYIHVRTQKYKNVANRHLPSFYTHLWELGNARILKHKDPNGYCVGYGQIKIWDPSKTSIQDMIAVMSFIMDELIRSYTMSSGNKYISIWDYDGVCFAHARQSTPRVLMQALDVFQNSFPGRPVAVHLVNAWKIVRMSFKLVRPLMKEKMRNRFHFHSSDFSTLHEHLSPSILPTCLGGELTDEEAFEDALVPKICSRDEFYKQLWERS